MLDRLQRFEYVWNMVSEVAWGGLLGGLVVLAQFLVAADSVENWETWLVTGVAAIGKAVLVGFGLSLKRLLGSGPSNK